MQLIFFLILLFVLGCLLYGIYAGVSVIGRIGSRMSEKEQQPILCPPPNDADTQPKASRDYIVELQALFALRQNGALTEEEFVQLKHHLLASRK